MSGKKIGYVRVSSFDQNPDRQIEGIKVDKIFVDKVSGKDASRPKLKALLDYAREGDTIIVHSMDRLARNLDDLRKLVKQFVQNDIRIEFVKEGLTFTGEDSPMSNLLLSVMGAFAEFERALIKERQREGIELAKKKGAYKGSQPKLSEEEIQVLNQLLDQGVPKTKIAEKFNITRQTIYRYITDTKKNPRHVDVTINGSVAKSF